LKTSIAIIIASPLSKEIDDGVYVYCVKHMEWRGDIVGWDGVGFFLKIRILVEAVVVAS